MNYKTTQAYLRIIDAISFERLSLLIAEDKELCENLRDELNASLKRRELRDELSASLKRREQK